MKKHLIAIFAAVLIVIAACLVSGCPTNSPVDTGGGVNNAVAPEEKIDVDHVHLLVGEDISFNGHAALPDGTILQSQLCVDDTPEAWWPADEYIQVQDEEWQITVRLGENGAPQTLSNEVYYLFKVWEKDNPSVMAVFPFDLLGPPAESELEQ